MQFLSSSIGRKVMMSISGQLMVLFAIVHLIGNTTIFGWINGGINAYAHHLHAFPPLVWAFRVAMLLFISVHICIGVILTIENSGGRPKQYAVKATQKTSFASENMIWTGALILIFIVGHLLHFTAKVIPGMTLVADAEGVVNVYSMILGSFQNILSAVIYIGAVVALFLHLSHGIQSSFQTLGWSDDKKMPVLVSTGTYVAVILLLGYISVPLSILFGILKG